MSIIMLGNVSVAEIERRLGIKLNDDDEHVMNESRQEAVNSTPLGPGKWHCFDLPFMIMTDTKITATRLRDMFMKYDHSKFKEQLQISWENE